MNFQFTRVPFSGIYSAVPICSPYLGSHIYSTLFYLDVAMRGSYKETWRSCNYYVRTIKVLQIRDIHVTPTVPTTNTRHYKHLSYYNSETHTTRVRQYARIRHIHRDPNVRHSGDHIYNTQPRAAHHVVSSTCHRLYYHTRHIQMPCQFSFSSVTKSTVPSSKYLNISYRYAQLFFSIISNGVIKQQTNSTPNYSSNKQS